MIHNNLTVGELAGWFTESIRTVLDECSIDVCATNIEPARPRNITCCPCSCDTRNGVTVTTWLDRVQIQPSPTKPLGCPCLTSVTFGIQIATCWPTSKRCDNTVRQPALDTIHAAADCIAAAACCGQLVPSPPPNITPCSAVNISDIITLVDCDTDVTPQQASSTRCCAGFETYITIR